MATHGSYGLGRRAMEERTAGLRKINNKI